MQIDWSEGQIIIMMKIYPSVGIFHFEGIRYMFNFSSFGHFDTFPDRWRKNQV